VEEEPKIPGGLVSPPGILIFREVVRYLTSWSAQGGSNAFLHGKTACFLDPFLVRFSLSQILKNPNFRLGFFSIVEVARIELASKQLSQESLYV
jgi:hypothetical protein